MKSKMLVLFCAICIYQLIPAQFIQFNGVNGMEHADIAVGDIDNDGDLDVIVSGVSTENGVEVPTSVILSNNNGTFELQASTEYQNPVFQPDLADPSVIRAADGWFYAYGTENTWSDGVHHLVPIIKSKNLINWQYESDAFSSRPKWKAKGGIWAPDVTEVNGKYYMYYSISTWGDANPGIGLAIADAPQGPFIDNGKIFDSQSIGVSNSIDPFLFQTGKSDTRKSYLFWGSFNGIYGIEMSDDLKSTIGNKFKIAGNAFEAPYILERNGKFFFFGSIGSCCEGANSQYRIGIASSTNIKGPYFNKKGQPIIGNSDEGSLFLSANLSEGWVGPGHNSKIVTDDAGNDFFLYHAIDVKIPNLPGGATRRPLMMEKINWANGWPEIQNGTPSNTTQNAPEINK